MLLSVRLKRPLPDGDDLDAVVKVALVFPGDDRAVGDAGFGPGLDERGVFTFERRLVGHLPRHLNETLPVCRGVGDEEINLLAAFRQVVLDLRIAAAHHSHELTSVTSPCRRHGR